MVSQPRFLLASKNHEARQKDLGFDDLPYKKPVKPSLSLSLSLVLVRIVRITFYHLDKF
jgi:hypothetical protein